MDADKQAQVLAAFELLAEEAGGTLADKPLVADVKAQGVDVTADERDEAWSAYTDDASPEVAENVSVTEEAPPDEPKPEKKGKGAASGKGKTPSVRNAYRSPLSIRGVAIPVGETRAVPGFSDDHPVLRRWLDAGVISVE